MSLDRAERLLWERIDGVITSEREAELEALLQSDAGARDLEQEVESVARRLGSLEEVLPPAELRRRIDGALDCARPPLARVQGAPARRQPRARREWRQLALPVAASLLLGMTLGLVVRIVPGPHIDPSSVTGALRSTPVRSEGQLIDIAEIGTVRVTAGASRVAVDIELRGDDSLELRLEGRTGALRLDDAAQPHASTLAITADDGTIVAHIRGAGGYRLAARPAPGVNRVQLTVTTEGRPIAARWVDLDAGGPSREDGW